MKLGSKILYGGAAFLIGIYFLFLCLADGKPFLAPFVTAVILSLLMVPVSAKLEKWGFKRVYASLTSTIFLLLLSIGFAFIVSLQISQFLNDWDKVKERMMPHVEQLEQKVYSNTPIDKQDLKLQDSISAKSVGKRALGFINSFYSFMGDYLLTFIYIFFLLNYRSKFRKFFIKLFPDEKKQEVSQVLGETASITQGYLFGKFLLIIFLTVLYAIGMGVSGVSNFIVISILAALLTIIPYIGNIIGFVLAIGLGYVTNGDTGALIGIIVTFTVGQFVESYILQPYVVGEKVNLDPLMTIIAVVAGSLLWGVIGMILSVPVLAIANVIFGHVEPLKPFGYLLGNNSQKDS
ncbi:AI-2E family transporter [Flavobacterium coralii]|uniref:AI-2E family transporter n=1 Tax=Flavobacterium coralii TaxID=2838017 RepID=UPI000C392299|nr:AI-2E family transporter [Flavobacterium sp.]|tara:strand:- start:68114 stop:69160 length:1047 start_codon:yes stop_codon:yes gene_type:complete